MRRIVIYFEPGTEVIEAYTQLKKVGDNHKNVKVQTIRNYFATDAGRKTQFYAGKGYEVRRIELE